MIPYLGLGLLLLSLTGCASIGHYYDSMDGCQFYNKPQGYRLPDYCGAGGKTSTTYVRQVTPTRYEITNPTK
ncbi:hypothetical protein UFOVP635_3 [uncultured Caudovirales phage]|uniref:Uncharacterized protein n=1 Tax=uncultured Caudovirales phage TaxID=2100421 RepID=A0A6J5N8N3_9CAUD|nr:hypothetical protein UFOVP635_3 [uncultured Caudovirales phage]